MVQKQQNGEVEIDLLKMAQLLIKKLPFIAAITILCGAIVLGATYFFVTPMYTASTTWYVNNSTTSDNASSITSSDLTASAKLVDTYKAIITSRTVLERVINMSGIDMSYEQLAGCISTATVNNTEVFKVRVKHNDPETAAKLANIITEMAPLEITDIVAGSSVKIIDKAVVPIYRSEPSYKKALMAGALLGFVLSCGFFVIRDLLDTSIKTETDFAEFEYPLLSTIPDLAQAAKSGKSGYGYGYSYAAARKGAH